MKTIYTENQWIISPFTSKTTHTDRQILSDVANPDSKTQTSPSWHRTKSPVHVDQRAQSRPWKTSNRRLLYTEQRVKGAQSHGHGTSEKYGPHLADGVEIISSRWPIVTYCEMW